MLALWSVPTADPSLAGYATHYATGLMQTVADNRGMSLDGYAGGVALNRCGDLGRRVWLRWEDGTVTGPLRVVDCAQRGHILDRERRRYVVEVDASLARRRGFFGIGPMPVVVLFEPPVSAPVAV